MGNDDPSVLKEILLKIYQIYLPCKRILRIRNNDELFVVSTSYCIFHRYLVSQYPRNQELQFLLELNQGQKNLLSDGQAMQIRSDH